MPAKSVDETGLSFIAKVYGPPPLDKPEPVFLAERRQVSASLQHNMSQSRHVVCNQPSGQRLCEND